MVPNALFPTLTLGLASQLPTANRTSPLHHLSGGSHCQKVLCHEIQKANAGSWIFKLSISFMLSPSHFSSGTRASALTGPQAVEMECMHLSSGSTDTVLRGAIAFPRTGFGELVFQHWMRGPLAMASYYNLMALYYTSGGKRKLVSSVALAWPVCWVCL